MTSKTLDRISRGDVVRGLGKKWEDFPDSIKDAIHEAMGKVEGSELVLEKYVGRGGDEYDLVYHISPEGVTFYVELSTAVGRTLVGLDSQVESAERRVHTAFGDNT